MAAVRRLIDRDRVFALICGSSSGSTLATLELVRTARVPFVTCITAHRDLLRPPSPYVYRIYANEIAQAEAVADYAARSLGSKRPAIIYNSNDFGIGGYQSMTARLKERWNTAFVAAVSYNPGDQDFNAHLLQVQANSYFGQAPVHSRGLSGGWRGPDLERGISVVGAHLEPGPGH